MIARRSLVSVKGAGAASPVRRDRGLASNATVTGCHRWKTSAGRSGALKPSNATAASSSRVDGRRTDCDDEGSGGTGGVVGLSDERRVGGRAAASESARVRVGTESRRIVDTLGDDGERRPSSSSTAGQDRIDRVELLQPDDVLTPPSEATLPDRDRAETLVAAVLMLSRPPLPRLSPSLDAECSDARAKSSAKSDRASRRDRGRENDDEGHSNGSALSSTSQTGRAPRDNEACGCSSGARRGTGIAQAGDCGAP